MGKGRAIVWLLMLVLLGAGTLPAAEVLSPDESARLLDDLLPNKNGSFRVQALRRAERSKDHRFIGPLIDILRLVRTQEQFTATIRALERLSGETIAPDQAFDQMVVWYGKQAAAEPPPGYLAWKGELFSRLIDPQYTLILYEDAVAKVRVEEVVWGGVRIGGIPALDNPKMLPAAEADYLTETEPVFGVSFNGDHRAYPLRILDWHEMANDIVGGRPVALAYCTLCGAGILFDPRFEGRTYRFGSSGLLFRSNKLMFDSATATLWNQVTGEPVIGRLATKDGHLRVLPLVLTSWAEWKRRHPDTKVLDKNTGYDRLYELGAAYGAYFGSSDTMFPVWQQSRVLHKKARVFTLRIEGRPKAYPLDELNRAGGVVNDTIGATSVVVVYQDAVGKPRLPKSWQKALAKLSPADQEVQFANDLSLEAIRAVLKKNPALLRELTVEMMLALPTSVRLDLLKERTPDKKVGAKAGKSQFTPDFRNEVALRGLIGDTRAYERRSRRFRPGDSPDTLFDEEDREWRITEAALLGPTDERYPRRGGHLAYWFGWFAFYPQTEIYKSEE